MFLSNKEPRLHSVVLDEMDGLLSHRAIRNTFSTVMYRYFWKQLKRLRKKDKQQAVLCVLLLESASHCSRGPQRATETTTAINQLFTSCLFQREKVRIHIWRLKSLIGYCLHDISVRFKTFYASLHCLDEFYSYILITLCLKCLHSLLCNS